MIFEEAMKAMREGKKITKKKETYYHANVVFYLIKDKMFCDNIDTGATYIPVESIRANFIVNSDWEVVDE